MILAALLVFYLARTIAHPLQSIPNDLNSDLGVTSISTFDPFGSIAMNIVARAQEDPRRVRTLWNIVYGCLATIALCTYTSIHPNMPNRHASFLSNKVHRISTSICALVAPELVILWAARQWVVARKVEKKYQDKQWTKTHGFFIQMGGFILEDQGTFKALVVDKEGGVCITAQDAAQNPEGSEEPEQRLEPYTGELPAISEEELNDKAKGDWLTKLLVILQTTWFIVRCIARRVEGLTLTQLELVTLAYATLNAFTYLFWWSKPKDAAYPVYFKANGERRYGPPVDSGQGQGMKQRLNRWKAWILRYTLVGPAWRSVLAVKRKVSEATFFPLVALYYLLLGLLFVIVMPLAILYCPYELLYRPMSVHLLVLMGFDLRGWTPFPPIGHFTYYTGELSSQEMLMLRCGLSVIGSLVGAIHLLGLTLDPPSGKDWKVCSIVITVIPISVCLHALISVLLQKLQAKEIARRDHAASPQDYSSIPTAQGEDASDDDDLHGIAHVAFVYGELGEVIGMVVVAAYGLARLYLFFLAYLELPKLPPSAFQEVDWTTFIPHTS